MPEEETNSSPSETQRAADETLQRSTPTEDAASQRDTAGEDIRDPEKKRLHDEAVSHKKRARDLEAQLKVYQAAESKAKEATLSDVEKANKRAIEAEAQIQQYKAQLVERDVRLASKDRGIINPGLYAPYVLSKLEYEDGQPTNLEKILDDLIKANPHIVPPVEIPAQPAQPTTQQRTAPVTPASNPGKSNTLAPGSLAPGKITTLADLSWSR